MKKYLDMYSKMLDALMLMLRYLIPDTLLGIACLLLGWVVMQNPGPNEPRVIGATCVFLILAFVMVKWLIAYAWKILTTRKLAEDGPKAQNTAQKLPM